MSNLGPIFIPIKLMLIPTWISVCLKIQSKTFTYGLAVNRKEYRTDNLVLVTLEAFLCSQVNGENHSNLFRYLLSLPARKQEVL